MPVKQPKTLIIESPNPNFRVDQIITLDHHEEMSGVPPQKAKVLRRATFQEYVGEIWANPDIALRVKQEHVVPLPERWHYKVEILTN